MGCCWEFLAQQMCLKHGERSRYPFDDGETNVLTQELSRQGTALIQCPLGIKVLGHFSLGIHGEHRRIWEEKTTKKFQWGPLSPSIIRQLWGIMMYLCTPQKQAVYTVQNHACCSQAYMTSDGLKDGTGWHCDWLHIWGLTSEPVHAHPAARCHHSSAPISNHPTNKGIFRSSIFSKKKTNNTKILFRTDAPFPQTQREGTVQSTLWSSPVMLKSHQVENEAICWGVRHLRNSALPGDGEFPLTAGGEIACCTWIAF